VLRSAELDFGTAPEQVLLTVKLRGRAEASDKSRGCTLSSRTRGDTTESHGPLQRLLDGIRTPFSAGENGAAIRAQRLPRYTASMNIKEMVADGRKVRFLHYKQGELWYRTETGFEFPVPIGDCGDGTFLAEDRAILFMRYIRAHVAYLEEAKRSHHDALKR